MSCMSSKLQTIEATASSDEVVVSCPSVPFSGICKLSINRSYSLYIYSCPTQAIYRPIKPRMDAIQMQVASLAASLNMHKQFEEPMRKQFEEPDTTHNRHNQILHTTISILIS